VTDVAPQHTAAIAAGAKCLDCPLYNKHLGPVPPTLPPEGSRIPFLVVAEAPGPAEVDEGETLIGPSGREVRNALANAGVDPQQVSYTNAILCKPPETNLEEYLRECKKKGLRSPLECCKPRLEAELYRADYAVFVGGAAIRAAGIGKSIMHLRGTPLLARPGLATLHPAFVLRDQGKVMRPIFWQDIAKAVRLANGGNTWRDPPYTVVYDPNTLAAMCSRMSLDVSVDTETDGKDRWTCNVRRVGLDDGTTNIIYAPLSVNGHWLLPEHVRLQCWQVLARFFSESRNWVFHNYFGFDSIVLERHGCPVNEKNLFDTLIGHRVGVTSEFPHGLDFLGSTFTDAPYWKDVASHEKFDD